MVSFDNNPIFWGEQCQSCSNYNKTNVCERNQKFIEKLRSMYHEYIGICEFKCDCFKFDENKHKNINNDCSWEK